MNEPVFGKIKWSMSRDEIAALVPPAPDQDVIVRSDDPAETSYDAEFRLSGQQARADFGFRNGRLLIVHIEIYVEESDFKQYCALIKTATSKDFGPPVNDDGSRVFWKTPFSTIFFRYDDKNRGGLNNSIIRVDLDYERR
jgi:hypothetical protein